MAPAAAKRVARGAARRAREHRLAGGAALAVELELLELGLLGVLELEVELEPLTCGAGCRSVESPGTPGWAANAGGTPIGGAPFGFCELSQAWNLAGVTTSTVARINAVARAAQLGAFGGVDAEPRRRDPQVVVIPGTASIFSEKSGTKKLWITSSERMLEHDRWSSARYRTGETIWPPPGCG